MQRERLTLMGQRIALGMAAAGITSESDLSRRMVVSRQTVRRLLYDPVVRVDAVTLFRLSDTVRLSARWILHGDGAPTVRMPLGPSTQRLVQIFDALPPDRQSILLHAATDLVEQ